MNHMRGLELIKNRIRLLAIAQIAILRGEEDPSFAVLGVGFRYGFDGLADEAGAAGYHDGGFGGAVDVVLGHDSFDTPKNEVLGVWGRGGSGGSVWFCGCCVCGSRMREWMCFVGAKSYKDPMTLANDRSHCKYLC